jgi:acetyl esterase
MAYALDQDLAIWAAALAPTDFTDVGAARAQMRALLVPGPAYLPTDPLEITDMTIGDAVTGLRVPIRIYAPANRDNRPLACLVYFHGGGFALGDLEVADRELSYYSDVLGILAISADYRLAPEHPFPAGLDDCYATLCWAVENATDLGIDRRRIAVAGESAGAGLAAAVALLARDRRGPQLCFQLLDLPVLDDRLDTPSMRAFVDTPIWDRRNAELSWQYYLGGVRRGGSTVSEYAAPARVHDLAGLPPAFVATAEFDPLRDEGIAYATRLSQAGVRTELHLYPGTFHGASACRDAAVSKRMARDRIDALSRALLVPMPTREHAERLERSCALQ